MAAAYPGSAWRRGGPLAGGERRDIRFGQLHPQRYRSTTSSQKASVCTYFCVECASKWACVVNLSGDWH